MLKPVRFSLGEANALVRTRMKGGPDGVIGSRSRCFVAQLKRLQHVACELLDVVLAFGRHGEPYRREA